MSKLAEAMEALPKTVTSVAMGAAYEIRVEPLFREGSERASAHMVTAGGMKQAVFETHEEASAFAHQCMWSAIVQAVQRAGDSS